MKNAGIEACERRAREQAERLADLRDESVVCGLPSAGALQRAAGSGFVDDEPCGQAVPYARFTRKPPNTTCLKASDHAALPAAKRHVHADIVEREGSKEDLAKQGNPEGGPDPVSARMRGKLRIDAVLEGKACSDSAYSEFVAAVTSACSSGAAESLGMTGCRLDEKKDPEVPGWLKVVLQVDFADGDFDSKRRRRIKLRRLLNERIRRAKRGSHAPERIDEIAGRFFITVSW